MWAQTHICSAGGTLKKPAQVPQRGMRRSSAYVSNLQSGKNRLGTILIENGNEVDVLVTSTTEEHMFYMKSVVKNELL